MLLKLIYGIERLNAGQIWFSGHDISRLRNSEVPFLRRQIGMIFQNHHLLMDRSVYDNVAPPTALSCVRFFTPARCSALAARSCREVLVLRLQSVVPQVFGTTFSLEGFSWDKELLLIAA